MLFAACLDDCVHKWSDGCIFISDSNSSKCIEELQPLFSILRGEGFRASGVQVRVRGAGPVQHVISRSTVKVPRCEASTHT